MHRGAIAAARRAVSLKRSEWRHHLRLAYIATGAERLTAALCALSMCSGIGIAHWLAATVYIARQQMKDALEHATLGCQIQDAQDPSATSFAIVGLHLLRGMILLALDDEEGALSEMTRECETAPPNHIMAPEACGNACCVKGIIYIRRGERALSDAALEEALTYMPDHPTAAVLLGRTPASRRPSLDPMPGALVKAGLLVHYGRDDEGVSVMEEALQTRQHGPGAAWATAIDPLLNLLVKISRSETEKKRWERVLRRIRQLSA
mgnify:CR=1 FL=1